MRNSIRTRLTVYFIGVAIVPLLLVGVVLTVLSLGVQRQQAIDSEKRQTERVSTEVTSFMSNLDNQLRTVVKGLRGLSPDEQRDLLFTLPSYPDVFQDIAIINASGKETVRISRLEIVTPDSLADRSKDNEFVVTKATNQVYYGPINVEKSGEPSMIIAMPMYNPRDRLVDGVIAAKIRFKPMWDFIASIQVAGGESVYILDSDHFVIAHLNPSVVLSRKSYTPPEDGITPGLSGQLSGNENFLNQVVLASKNITFGTQVFTVVAERPLSEALGLAYLTALVAAVLLVAALAVATVLGIFASRRIVHPIQRLAVVAQALTIGTENVDLVALKDVVGNTDELGQLARLFTKMSEEVKVREDSLKLQVQELRIEIDETKKAQQVAEIVETDYFRDLQNKARDLRKKTRPPTTEEPSKPPGESGN